MQEIIMRHEGVLGEFRSTLLAVSRDVSYIRGRVDDGLAVTVARIDKDLATSIAAGKADAAEIKADVGIAAEKLRGENWLGHIVTGSVGKLIGIAVAYMIVNALASSGLALLIKEKYSLELPGQQKEILKQQAAIQSTLNIYHTHQLSNGDVLYHSGDINKSAWILNSRTNVWERAPSLRTEEGIK
jgi:hypothetical protein